MVSCTLVTKIMIMIKIMILKMIKDNDNERNLLLRKPLPQIGHHLPQLNRRYEPGDYQNGEDDHADDGHGWDDPDADDGEKTMILTRPDSCQRR